MLVGQFMGSILSIVGGSWLFISRVDPGRPCNNIGGKRQAGN